jgi:hypothetical protein
MTPTGDASPAATKDPAGDTEGRGPAAVVVVSPLTASPLVMFDRCHPHIIGCYEVVKQLQYYGIGRACMTTAGGRPRSEDYPQGDTRYPD